MNKYLDLFLSFSKIGLFTFGGGYAMLPLIERDMVEKKKLISGEEMTDIVAVSESTPGPLAINCATFVGYKVGGFWGALISTLSVVFPPFVIILIISLFLKEFLALEYVKYAFMGIKVAVAILILEAAIKLFRKAKKGLFFYAISVTSLLLALFLTEVEPAWIILASGIIGAIYSLIMASIEKKKKDGEDDAPMA